MTLIVLCEWTEIKWGKKVVGRVNILHGSLEDKEKRCVILKHKIEEGMKEMKEIRVCDTREEEYVAAMKEGCKREKNIWKRKDHF